MGTRFQRHDSLAKVLKLSALDLEMEPRILMHRKYMQAC